MPTRGRPGEVKVTFVHFDGTIRVHARHAEAEIDRSLLWQHLLATLDEKERRVVVCLRSGFTTATEIAAELDYASHSPISKTLAAIRKKALRRLA